jgi:cytochrome b6-f complex iron-sulfur subunit
MNELLYKPVKRRDFLGIAAVGTFLAALTTACLGVLRLVVPQVFAESPRSYKIGEPDGFPSGDVRIPPGRSVYVFHDHNGYFAISAKCTHLGCIVKHSPQGFLCPCHGSRFTPEGRVISGSASKTLDWYSISLAPDGQLVVDEGKTVKPGTFFVV